MAQVTATVGLKTQPFKQGLAEMKASAQKWGDDIKSTVAGAFAVGAVVNFVGNFVKEMARVQDIADRLGMSATEVQKVGNAAAMSGTDLETVIKVLTKLTGEAAKSGDAFAALGINAAEFANAGYEQQVVMLAGAYEEANGSQEKMIQLMTILGGKGQDVLPLLAQGAKAAAEQMAGIATVTDGTVAAMSRLDDFSTETVQRMKSGFGSIIGLGTVLMRTIHGIANGKVGAYDAALESLGEDSSQTNTAKKSAVFEDAEAAKKVIEEKKKITKALRDLESEMTELARSRMDDEQKIADLKKEQWELSLVAGGGTELERIEAAKTILGITKEIESIENGISKKKQDEATKSAKIAKDKEDATDDAEMTLERKQIENERAKMTPQQRIAVMKSDQKALMDASKKEQDAEKSAKMKLEALNIGDDIKSEEDKLAGEKKKPQNPNVVSSSLAAIGGGGGVFISQGIDPALAEARNQTSVLRQIAQNTSPRSVASLSSKSPF